MVMMLASFGCVKAEIVIVADEETSINISEISNITFDGDFNTGNIVVNYTDGTTGSMPVASVHKITFKEDEEPSGIAEVSTKASVAVKGDMLFLTADGGCIGIFDVNGVKMMQMALDKGTNVLSLQSLAKGVYVLNVNGQTLKFEKR